MRHEFLQETLGYMAFQMANVNGHTQGLRIAPGHKGHYMIMARAAYDALLSVDEGRANGQI